MKRVLAFLCAVAMVMTMCSFTLAPVTIAAAATPNVTTLAEFIAKMKANQDIVLGADIDFQPNYDLSYNAETGNIDVVGVGNQADFTIGTGYKGTTRLAVSGIGPDGTAITALPADLAYNALLVATYDKTLDGNGYKLVDYFGKDSMITTLSRTSMIKNISIEAFLFIGTGSSSKYGIISQNLNGGNAYNVSVDNSVLSAELTGAGYIRFAGMFGLVQLNGQTDSFSGDKTIDAGTMTVEQFNSKVAANKNNPGSIPVVDRCRTNGGLIFLGNTVSGANLSIGGIAGICQCGYFYNCQNSATIYSKNSGWGTAGIVGAVEVTQNAFTLGGKTQKLYGQMAVAKPVRIINCANLGEVIGVDAAKTAAILGYSDVTQGVSDRQEFFYNNLYNSGLVRTEGSATGNGKTIGTMSAGAIGAAKKYTVTLVDGDGTKDVECASVFTPAGGENIAQELNWIVESGKGSGGNLDAWGNNCINTRNATTGYVNDNNGHFGNHYAVDAFNGISLGHKGVVDGRVNLLWKTNENNLLELDFDSSYVDENGKAHFNISDGSQIYAIARAKSNLGNAISGSGLRTVLRNSGFERAEIYIHLKKDVDINPGYTFEFDTANDGYIKATKTADGSVRYFGTGRNSATYAHGTWYESDGSKCKKRNGTDVSEGVFPNDMRKWQPLNTLFGFTGTSPDYVYDTVPIHIDGEGHTLKGVLVANIWGTTDVASDSMKYNYGTAGFVTNLTAGSEIKNLTIDNSFVWARNNGGGAFAARIWNGGRIESCTNKASVVVNALEHNFGGSTSVGAGGIVGIIKSNTGRNYSYFNDATYIIGNKNYGCVYQTSTTKSDIGGIVGGAAQGCVIKYNENYGKVVGKTTGEGYGVGGIVGGIELGAAVDKDGNKPRALPIHLECTYNANYGEISALSSAYPGGVVGHYDLYWASGSETYLYVCNNIHAGTGVERTYGNANGSCQKATGVNLDGTLNTGFGTPKVTSHSVEDGHIKSTFTGKDFADAIRTVNEKYNDEVPEKIWWVDYKIENKYLPVLMDNDLGFKGQGTSASPIEITTADQLYFLSEMTNYKLNEYYAGKVDENGKLASELSSATINSEFANFVTAKYFAHPKCGDVNAAVFDWCFKLMNDIDLNPGLTVTPGEVPAGEWKNFQPMFQMLHTEKISAAGGTNGCISYSGTFDGNGKTISGLYSVDEYGLSAGLIASNYGTIKNLTFTNAFASGASRVVIVAPHIGGGAIDNVTLDSSCYVKATGSYIGGISSWHQGGDIKNCTSYATVEGASQVGGLSAWTQCNVFDCKFGGHVKATSNQAGGIIGSFTPSANRDLYNNIALEGSTVEAGNLYAGGICGSASLAGFLTNTATGCKNYAKVKSATYAGGFSGAISNGKIDVKNFENHGEIEATSSNAGGVFGQSQSINGFNIDSVKNYGNVKSKYDNAGGIVGVIDSKYLNGQDAAPMTIQNCENYGSVTANKQAGGILGLLNNTVATDINITSCLNKASVTGTSESAGGIVGYARQVAGCDTNILNCVNEGEVTGNIRVGGIVGRAEDSTENSFFVISKNENKGNVVTTHDTTGDAATGGIVGWIYPQQKTAGINCIFVTYNINSGAVKAPKSLSSNIGTIAGTVNGEVPTTGNRVKSTYVFGNLNLSKEGSRSANGTKLNAFGWGEQNLSKNYSVVTGTQADGLGVKYLTDEQIENGCATYLINALTISEIEDGDYEFIEAPETASNTTGTVLYQTIGDENADTRPYLNLNLFDENHEPMSVTSQGETLQTPGDNGKIFLGYKVLDAATGELKAGYVKGTLAYDAYVIRPVFLDFHVEEGASIRKSNPSGLKFDTVLEKDYLSKLGVSSAQHGTIIMPKSLAPEVLDAGAILNDVTLQKLNIVVDGFKAVDADGMLPYSASVVNVKDIYRDYVAISYIKYTVGDETVYITARQNVAANTRSIHYVANALVNDPEVSASDYTLSIWNMMKQFAVPKPVI